MTHNPHNKEVPAAPVFGQRPEIQPVNVRHIFRYVSLLHKVREYPNQWAQIAIFDDASPDKTRRRLNTVCAEVMRYLRKYYPLEVWDISRRTIPDTWARRELWVRYCGEISPELALEMREARKEIWKKGRLNGEAKRAARETVQRIRGMAENREMRLLAEHQRREQQGG